MSAALELPRSAARIAIPRAFSARNNGRCAVACALNAIVVVCAGPLAYHLHNPWLYALAFVVVGARAQALYILQHEAMHSLLFSRRSLNDAVGVVVSALVGTRLHEGRRFHFKHHRELGKHDDPNRVWYDTRGRGPGWPILKHFVRQLCGARLQGLVVGLWAAVRGRVAASPRAGASSSPSKSEGRDIVILFAVQALLFALMTITASWWVYFLLYLLPIATLTCLFEAIRSFSEHVLPGQATSSAETFRLFFMDAPRFELFFISQFYFNYHHLHHLYPTVPTHKLRQLHGWLSANDPDYANRYIRRPGYVATLLLYARNRPLPGAGAHYPLQESPPHAL